MKKRGFIARNLSNDPERSSSTKLSRELPSRNPLSTLLLDEFESSLFTMEENSDFF